MTFLFSLEKCVLSKDDGGYYSYYSYYYQRYGNALRAHHATQSKSNDVVACHAKMCTFYEEE
jgi:hypothetical protein